MADFIKARAHLMQAFTALEGASPEDARLQRATALLIEAVVRMQREMGVPDNVVQFRPGSKGRGSGSAGSGRFNSER